MSTWMRFFVSFVLLITGAAWVHAAPKKSTTLSPIRPNPAWRILYEKGKDIWTMRADGSGKHRLFSNALESRWSFDHRKIAFMRQGNAWVANADGTNAHAVTHWPPQPMKSRADNLLGLA